MAFSIRQKGYIFIAIAMIELSLLAILSSIGAKNIGTMQLLFFTFLVATATSLLLVLYKKKTPELKRLFTDRRSLAILAIAGILNYAGAQLFLTMGVLGTNPVIVSVVLKLWPILLAIMIPFTIKTKVEKLQMLALLIAFAGVYVIATKGSLLSINVQELPYIGLLVVSTLCTAVSNIMIKGRNHDIYSEVFLFNIASLAVIALLIPILHTPINLDINASALVSILFLGAVTYGVGALLFFYALKALNPLVAANASYSTPFLTIVFSYIILGTQLHAYYIYALALMITALVIQNRYSKRAPRYMSAKRSVQFFDVTGAFVENTHPQIHPYIRGNGRALAAVVKAGEYAKSEDKDSHGCLVFTNKNPLESVARKEIEFIESIISHDADEIIILAIGEAGAAEEALNDHTAG